MVDPGVPLGPGLLATWVSLQGPHTKNANARINTATIAANFRPLTLPSRSLFCMQSPVLVVQTLLHATELGLNKTCRTLFRQTCRDFDPQADGSASGVPTRYGCTVRMLCSRTSGWSCFKHGCQARTGSHGGLLLAELD